MLVEDLPAYLVCGDKGSRFSIHKLFVDRDVTGFFQFPQMGTQVSIGDLQLIPGSRGQP